MEGGRENVTINLEGAFRPPCAARPTAPAFTGAMLKRACVCLITELYYLGVKFGSCCVRSNAMRDGRLYITGEMKEGWVRGAKKNRSGTSAGRNGALASDMLWNANISIWT